jgi:hypothetical protein
MMRQQEKSKKPKVRSTVNPNPATNFNDFAKNILEWRKELLGQEVNKT